MTNEITRTDNFGFSLIRFSSPRWQDREWSNWRTLDTILQAVTGLSNVLGEWQNSTAYVVGNRVIDTDVHGVYQCAVSHTSAADPTTFEEDRDDNPTYWVPISSLPVYRGQWVTATAYNRGDFLFDGYRFGVCIENFTSGATYNADVSDGNIVTLIDLTDAIEDAENIAAGIIATSTTSLLIGTGSKVFTTQEDKQFVVGTRLRAASAADPSNLMEGEVTAYAGTSLTIDVDYTEGAGTLTDWNITIAGARGATGPQGPAGAGNGDVIGPGTHTDLTIPVFDGINTNTIQDSGSTIADLLDRTNHTGTQAQATVTNLVSDLAAKIAASILTTRGDIITRDASNPVRLAKGSQYQVLTGGATDLTWGAVDLSQATAVTGVLAAANLPDASTTAEGVVELATSAETETGTDTVRAVTPAGAAATYIKRSLLTSQGDIITRDGSAPKRLAKGAQYSVLQAGASEPEYAAVNLAQSAAVTGTLPNANLPLGKKSIWVPWGAMLGNPAGAPPTTTLNMGASNFNAYRVGAFDSSVAEVADFLIRMPKSWNLGTITFIPVWSHPSTTTNFGVVWALQAVAISNDDSLNVAYGSPQSSTDTGGTTNDLYEGPESSAITIGGSPAAGDSVAFQVSRVPSSGSDTLAVDAYLHGILILYTENSLNDN